MIEIEKPRIETLELSEDGKYGKFVMEPLERGYAITLGNSLRRVLLSTLPGSAITNVKIDGVVHEFSTIPGVKEDVTEIVLNLKGLITKLHTDSAKKIYIEAEGPCVLTAASIKNDFEVEILTEDSEKLFKFSLYLCANDAAIAGGWLISNISIGGMSPDRWLEAIERADNIPPEFLYCHITYRTQFTNDILGGNSTAPGEVMFDSEKGELDFIVSP